jgi:DNA-binding transcriptional MerR regulator
MNDTIPIYNLKAVIKKTGLSPATLRAWERRYGLIKPHRSAGGHRLYSRRDIELLKWLVARQQEGLSISQAVGMWKVQQERTIREAAQLESHTIPSPSGGAMIFELREQWLTACRAFDEAAANRILDQAFAITSPETVSIEILQKGLAQIGQEWYVGEASVQQEHFASSMASRRLDTLFNALVAPARPETILAACPPGEEHGFILLLVSYLLRRKGWDVLYLGSNVPFENLDKTITSTHPALVLSAAQTLTGAASLREMSKFIASQGIPLAFGGGIFDEIPEIVRRISGYYLGSNLAALPGMIELMVITSPGLPEVLSPSPENSESLGHLKIHESAILARVGTSKYLQSIDRDYVELACGYLTRMIEAALQLGDIHLLDPTTRWLKGLLSHRGVPGSLVQQFYYTYRQAVEEELGTQGKIIAGWLKNAESRANGR